MSTGTLHPTLRIAELADLSRIVATYNATVPSRLVTADLDPVTVESRRPWFFVHDPTRRPLWLVEQGGVYQGWLSLQASTDDLPMMVSPRFRSIWSSAPKVTVSANRSCSR